ARPTRTWPRGRSPYFSQPLAAHRDLRTFPTRRSSDLPPLIAVTGWGQADDRRRAMEVGFARHLVKPVSPRALRRVLVDTVHTTRDRKSTRLNSSHVKISYAVFCSKKKTRHAHEGWIK